MARAKAGRKRKQGQRHPCGRLVSPYDKGTQRAQAMRAIYGENCSDAIGRAYSAGLLGHGSEAKALLDTARRIAGAYWRALEVGRIGSCLEQRQPGFGGGEDAERARRIEAWLTATLREVDALGADTRRLFDQLVIDPNPDCGPPWLDRLCAAARDRRAVSRLGDMRRLRTAVRALAEVR